MGEETSRICMESLVQEAIERKATDIHLTPGAAVRLRVDGALEQLSEEEVSPEEVRRLLEELLEKGQQEQLRERGQLVFVREASGLCRLRVSVFRRQGDYAVTLRLLPTRVPTPQELGMPEALTALAAKKRGIVLVAGVAGSGRTTTLAALTAEAARTDARTVVTIESPVEYVLPQGRSLVLQREVGSDIASVEEALRMVQWQDADVVQIGELRGQEAVEEALAIAEGGRLVLAGVAADSVAAVVERMTAGSFPQQQRLRGRLSETLAGIVTRRLLPRQTGAAGRAAVYELLLADTAVRKVIREGSLEQLAAALETGRRDGMQTMDDAIYDLYMKSEISGETAIAYARDPEGMQHKLRLF